MKGQGDQPNHLLIQAVSNSYSDQTHIPIISTSLSISHTEPCELSLISPIFKPLIFIQLIWLQFAFSINDTTRKSGGRGWKRSWFSDWVWNVDWLVMHGKMPEMQRCWRSTSGAPPSALRTLLRGAPLHSSIRSSERGERAFKKTRIKERELAGSVWFVLRAAVPCRSCFISPQRDTLSYIHNSSERFCYSTPKYWINQVTLKSKWNIRKQKHATSPANLKVFKIKC